MFDPDSLLERLEMLWRSTRDAMAARRVELYARTAIRLRVRTEGTGPAVVERGHDVGLAVRAVDSSGRIGFARYSSIPAARHASRSPCIALAVIATIRIGRSRNSSA